MRFSSTLAAVVALAASAAEANLSDLGIPKVIKPGDVFSAIGHLAIQQPRQQFMAWAVTWPVYDVTYPGSIGTDIFKIIGDLPEVVGSQYNVTIPGLQIREGYDKGETAIQAVIVDFTGVFNLPSLETWYWPVTIGDETSEELVYATSHDPNSRGCTVPSQ